MRSWVLPTLLAAVAAGSLTGTVAVETASQRAPDRQDTVPAVTPVLSVRRLPEALGASVAERRLRADLEEWSGSLRSGSCATVVAPSDATVLDVDGEEPVGPASTLKLLTATAALIELGPTARFRTSVLGSVPVDGVVTGDLTLLGGGDPVLATPAYAARFERPEQIFTDVSELAHRIAEAGVRRVEGSVVGDDSRYDGERYVEGWPARYVAQDVVGPLSALAVNDGFSSFPPTWGGPGELVPAADPAAHAAAVLTFLLQAQGVEVVGPPRAGPSTPGGVELASLDSPPLTELVREMLEESDNNTAELLLKELGRAAGDPTTAGGRERAQAVLRSGGLDVSGVRIVDGSGLSPENRVTCRVLVASLTRAETGAQLRAALPVAGETGTLFDRFLDTPLVGSLRAKTGSLNTVAGLAGFVVDGDGALPFAYVHNVDPSERLDMARVDDEQRRLAEILLAWPQVAPVTALGPRSSPGR